ncbi:MAG: 2Fe-2S iron-sulfur cluster-binding protein [Spirochaetes bacterium]|nr:2Fe-2S iron-sulfur cluster-binding protein [Spirochaetota bacterium]
MKIRLRVNGKMESVEADPGTVLADILRKLGHVEVKKACGTGACGLCTVLLDGKPVPSCSILAGRADGHEITTIRGIGEEAKELASFLTAEGAEQCGYCSPGLALMVLAMAKELASPTPGEIKHYLAGNLCRCSGYEGQLRAVLKYLEARRG